MHAVRQPTKRAAKPAHHPQPAQPRGRRPAAHKPAARPTSRRLPTRSTSAEHRPAAKPAKPKPAGALVHKPVGTPTVPLVGSGLVARLRQPADTAPPPLPPPQQPLDAIIDEIPFLLDGTAATGTPPPITFSEVTGFEGVPPSEQPKSRRLMR